MRPSVLLQAVAALPSWRWSLGLTVGLVSARSPVVRVSRDAVAPVPKPFLTFPVLTLAWGVQRPVLRLPTHRPHLADGAAFLAGTPSQAVELLPDRRPG